MNASSFPTMTSMTSKRVVYWPTQEYTKISGTTYAIPLHGPNARFCHAGHIQFCRTDDDWPGLNYTQTQTVNLTGPQIVSWSASVSSARGSDCSSSYSSAERAYRSAAMTTHYVVSGFTRRSYLNTLSTPDQNACCGARCALNNPRADVLFFPSAGGNTATVFVPPTKTSTSIPKGGNTYSTRKSSTTVSYPMITSQIAALPRAIQARVKSFVANDSSNAAAGDAAVTYPTMLVSDGYTFRAPSIYIIFHEVWASDLCGIRGTPRTAVTLGFGPGELSTLIGPQDMPIYGSMALDPADLPCPRSWRPGAGDAEENCKPLIVPPQKLLDVDPLWHGCEANQFQGLDPPRALAPAAAIDPAVTVAGPRPKPTPADPASAVGDPGPLATTPAGNANKPWPVANTNPSDPAKPGENGSNDQQPSNPQPANPQPASPQAANTQPVNAQPADSKPADPQPANPQPVNPSNSQSQNQGDSNQGSNSGNSNPQPQQNQESGGSNSNPQPQQNQDSSFQDSGFGDPNSQPQQNPPAVVVQGQTVAENAPPVTIGGTPVVYSSGSLYVGGNAAPIVTNPISQQQQPQNSPNPAIVGGYTFSPAPSSPQPVAPNSPAVVVEGQTIAENGPPVVIGGSTLAYSGGSVYVGGNAAPAPTSSPQNQQAASDPAVIGGLTFSQAPAAPDSPGAVTNAPAVIVEGQTIKENAPPITIGGSPVAFSAGSVYVGSSAAPAPVAQQQKAVPNPAVVGGLTFSQAPADPGSQGAAKNAPAVVVQGQTIKENGPPITIGGSPVAFSAGSVYVGSSAAAAPVAQQQQPNPAVVAGFTFSNAPLGAQEVPAATPAVVVQGQTIAQGGAPVTINGDTIRYSAGSIYVGNDAVSAPTAIPQQQAGAPAVIGGLTFSKVQQPGSQPAVVVQGQTIAQGGPPVTINGEAIKYSAGSIYVGNSATAAAPTAIPQQQNGAPVVVGGLTFSNVQQPGLQPAVIVQGQTIAENGSPVTINGNEVKYSSGSIYVGNSAVAAPTANQQSNANPAVLGGMTYSIVQPNAQAVAQPTGFVFNGQTIVNGAPPITIQGQPVSLGAAGLVVGGSTYARPSAAPIALVGGQFLTVGPSGIEVGGKLLTPGAPAITIAGTPISLGPVGVVVGSSTIAITAPPGSRTPLITVAGHTVAAGPLGAIAIDGMTLTPGGAAITVSGTPISLGASGLVVGTRTIPLPASSVFQVGGQTFTANPTAFAVAGTTLSVGGPAATISGTVVSLGPSGLQIGTQTYALPSSPQSVFAVGDQTFTANPTAFAVAGTTLSVGGPAATISGTVVSLGPSGLQIGSKTYTLPSATQSVFTVGDQTFTANPTAFAVAGTTLSVGGPAATVSGTVISLGPSGLQIGSKTYALPSATQSVFTVGSQTFTANPTGFVIAPGTTLTRGGAATISGTVVSLASNGDLVVGGSTIHLPTPTQSVFTIGDKTFTANPTGFVIAPGTTLTRGGAATISGTVVSLASNGDLVIGGRTIPLPTPTQSVFTIGDKTFTANPTGFVIAPGTTITPGGVATISGTVISLASNGDLVIGSSSTIRLSRGNATATTTAGNGLGPAIISGLGGPGPTSTNAPADEEAKGTTRDLPLSLLLGILLVVAVWGYC